MEPEFDWKKFVLLAVVTFLCAGLMIYVLIADQMPWGLPNWMFIVWILGFGICNTASWRMVGDWKYDRDDMARKKRLKEKAEQERLDQIMGRK